MRIKDLIEATEKSKKDNSDLSNIQSNVYGNETEYGKAKTDKPNYAGALGPMQILPSTFSWMQKTGIIPKDYDIRDPEQNKAAGDALLAHYYKKYDGDPAKVYAAYYAGPGAINKDGTINTHWRDLKNPKAPTVGEYIARAMARSGETADIKSRSKNTNVEPREPKSVTVASKTEPKSVATDNTPKSVTVASKTEPKSVSYADSDTFSNIGSSIGNFYDKVKSDLTSVFSAPDDLDKKEIALIIGGKKRKFKSKKEAEMAIKLAMQSGEEIKNV